MEENIEIFDDETAREAAYERWRESDDKSGLSTDVLRMSLHGSKQCADGMHRGHIVDLELAVDALQDIPGAKPSFEYVMAVAEELRFEDNWRALTAERNQGKDRETAAMVMSTSPSDKTVSGHARSKVRDMAEWLIAHQRNLPERFVDSLGNKLAAMRDADTGESMLDRRKLASAGADFRVQSGSSPSQREIAHGRAQIEALSGYSSENKATLNRMVVDGSLMFNKDGSVDQRSAAVRQRDLLVRVDDGRSKALSNNNNEASPSKTVHVPSYVRRDGTVVASHDRSIPSPSREYSSPSSVPAASPSPGKTAHVPSYVRQDGTVVASHTRSAPSPSKSSPSSGSGKSSGSSSGKSSGSSSGKSSGSSRGRK